MSILHHLLDENSAAGRRFAFFIQGMIILSIITFSLETVPELERAYGAAFHSIELATLIIFVIEYLLRVAFSQKRLAFVFSFFGIVDLIAILPAFIGADFRAMRALRLIRIFKLFRYSASFDRIGEAFSSVRRELTLFFTFTILLIYVSSVGIYFFEHEAQPEVFRSILDCLWWSVATLTTVGYGDIYPVTAGGRLFTTIVVMVGIGIIAVPTGLISSALTKVVKGGDE